MQDLTYKIILTYRIRVENPNGDLMYRSLQAIAENYKGKHDATTSTYLFQINNYDEFQDLFKSIETDYNNIILENNTDYDDEIRAFIGLSDGRFIVASLELKYDDDNLLSAFWSDQEFADYYASVD